jgi:hypothetical protein
VAGTRTSIDQLAEAMREATERAKQAKPKRVAVDFFEQGRGTSFRHVMHADCRGRPTRTDAAALYATAQAALKDRQE